MTQDRMAAIAADRTFGRVRSFVATALLLSWAGYALADHYRASGYTEGYSDGRASAFLEASDFIEASEFWVPWSLK